MKIDEPEAGEWVSPVRKGYFLVCCDCGLVHEMDFRIHKKHIEFRCFSAPRRTGQIRRSMKVKKEGVFKKLK
jgi:hypothetical protein